MSIGEIGETLRRIILSLPFPALGLASSDLEQAEYTLAQCAAGSSSNELLEAVAQLNHGLQQVASAHQYCLLIRDLLQQYVVEIGAIGGENGKGSPSRQDSPKPASSGRTDSALIAQAQRQGHKISADKVLRIGRDRDGRVVWLEEGHEQAGARHLMAPGRVSEFAAAGVNQVDIVDVVFRAATMGNPVGISGRNRLVFETEHQGKKILVAITIGSNGYIVGANPVHRNRKIKPLP